MKKRHLVGVVVAGALAWAFVVTGPSDIWDAFCAGICPWSTLCVPPICDPSQYPPSGGGSQGS